MKPDKRFLKQPKNFWANVRSLSQRLGYTDRATKQIKVFSIDDIIGGLKRLDLSTAHVVNDKGEATEFGKTLHGYFVYRAKVINEYVRPRLMTKERAAKEFETLYKKLDPKCPIPLNKQTGEKTGEAYLTGIVNMLVEQAIGACPCNYNPQVLATITRDGVQLGLYPGAMTARFQVVLTLSRSGR